MNKIIKRLKKIADSHSEHTVVFDDGTELEIDGDTATLVLDIYETLEDYEKSEFEDKLSVSSDDFISVLNGDYGDNSLDDLTDLLEE